MNNEARRKALDTARTQAYTWASLAQVQYAQGQIYLDQQIAMATMWADVAQALKTGDASGDTPDH